MKILVIDDDEFFVENLCAYIKKFYRVTFDHATCAKCGLKKIAEKEYDLVITEIALPDRQHSEWLVEIAKHRRDQRIIVVSSRNISLEYGLAKKINLIGYFEKPFDIQIMVNLINQLIQNSIKL